MILYLIQAHTDVEQLVALTERLFDGENVILINLDPVFGHEAGTISRLLAEKKIHDVIVRIGIPLNWGGISQVYASLDAMQYALGLKRPWRMLVNLSADSVPLVPPSVVRRFYLEGLRKKRRVYLSFFGNAPGWKASGFVTMPWGGEQGFDASAETGALYRRASATIDHGAKSLFADRARNPVFNARLRGALHVNDLFVEKKLLIRRLLPYEADYRARAFGNRLFHGGRCWYALERNVVDEVLSDPLTAEILHCLEHFLCPDELFLQTYVMNSGKVGGDEIVRNNQWFERGDSVAINDGMADRLFSSGAFFARKGRLRECRMIRSRIDDMLQQQQ